MTEHDWLTCTDPAAMLRFRPAARIDLIVAEILGPPDEPRLRPVQERLMRRVLTAGTWAAEGGERAAAVVRCLVPFRPPTPDPSWLTPTVVGLARAIYEDRAFHNLPVLADALEEAGCSDAGVLEHCRGGGEHTRGCFVIDMLTGRA